MNGKGDISKIQNSVQNTKNAPDSRIADALQLEDPCSSHDFQQRVTLNQDWRSQECINVCVMTDDSDLQNMKLSDTESDFAGFASLTSSNGKSCQKHCVLKKNDIYLNMKNREFPQETPKEQSKPRSQANQEKVEHPDLIKCRKKLNETEELDNFIPTPMDQVVEINSMSTTSSEAYKRQKINSKHQLRLLLNKQTLNSNSHNNKCSTETTSDFPVSSPSNPPARHVHQKNTLPADIFERNLALLTAENPQMSLEEKINAWKCDLDLSDVEDVCSFDDLFKEHEELKQKVLLGKRNIDGELTKYHYDFTVFRNEVLPRISAAASLKEKKEKISTSSVGTLSAQRRLRAAFELECKKRQHTDLLKGRGATTPTFTSSSENELLFNSVSKKIFNSAPPKVRQRSSESGNKMFHEHTCGILRRDEPIRRHSQSTIRGQQALARRHRPSADEESGFKLRRLNREVDKIHQRKETNPRGLIQMRFDFAIQNKSQHLHEKKRQLFKTPTVPPKYLSMPAPSLLPMPMPIALTAPMPKSKETISFSNSNNTCENLENRFHQYEDNAMPKQIASASPHEADRSYTAFTPTSKNITSAGTCHQQHEFCNYLGLTGMSTANAVANAVAELAKCNLARRSLRVRRLKQQEIQENNQKLTKYFENADGLEQILTHEMVAADESYDQKDGVSNLAEMSVDLSETKSQLLTEHSSTLAEEITKNVSPIASAAEKEPEIKVVCKISSNADKEEEVEKYTRAVAAPIRKTLLRHLKQNVVNSNDTSTCPRSSISDDIDCDEMSSNATPNILQKSDKKLQPDCRLSPTQISICSSFKNTNATKSVEDPDCIKLQLHDKFRKYLEASRKIKPSICIVQALHNPEPRQCSLPEKNSLADGEVEIPFEEKKILNIQASKKSKISGIRKQNKKQQNRQEKGKNVTLKGKGLLQSKPRELSSLSKQKKKEQLRKLLALATPWCKIKNHRQLRSRKILLVKRIRSTPNTIVKSTEKRVEVEQMESRSIVSSVKSGISGTKSSKSRKERHQRQKNKYIRIPRKSRTSRSTPSPADTSTEQHDPRTSSTGLPSPLRKPQATSLDQRRRQSKSCPLEGVAISPVILTTGVTSNAKTDPQALNQECETVVVSSTTNSYDEATLHKLNNSPSQISNELKPVQNNESYAILTKDRSTQSALPLGIHFLSTPSKQLPNPVKHINGRVDYIYYEMDVLIVVQEKVVSFWKYFKLINALAGSQECNEYSHRMSNRDIYLPSYASTGDAAPKWLPLGECRRLVVDIEISNSYANRICIHNSIPIYVEMRCREIPRERRDCNLLSMYVNIYYFNDEDMVAKMHSIQLDAVQGLPSDVVYTTITESRYFVMAWPQENILGKPRSGLCKYSLTPNLDTLASIRDFKHIRHCIRYLECTTDDKLIGFGDTQLTLWDHRSGDVLTNYDFNIKLGQNLGSIYYPSLEIGQNSMLIFFQHINQLEESELAEVMFIACSVSHTTPSHRILKRLKMPSLAFGAIQNAINTGDNIVITAKNDEEVWINCADATTVTRVPPQHTRRFYARGRSQIIELTCKTLTVDSFANHVLKLAANPAVKYDV